MDSAVCNIMDGLFRQGAQIVLSTREGNQRWARTVDAYYEDGAFYIVTHIRSGKILQIKNNPAVTVCSSGLNVNGTGENLGSVLADENRALAEKIRMVFPYLDNGESSAQNCILRIRLTTGVLFSNGVKYDLDFTR